ncbi:MAG: carboxypeptidase-like regulatory domain-containing protein [Vicinamibacterales bacterium]
MSDRGFGGRRAARALMLALGIVGAWDLAGAGHLGARQVRDARVRPAGTGTIGGRVLTADAEARPVRRAVVTLSGEGLGQSRSVVTGDDGRFELERLPAGRFSLIATKPGYLDGSFGARRPGGDGTTIALEAGGRLEATLRLTHGAVLAGVVRDERGRPVRNIAVMAVSVTTASAGTGAGAATTEVRTNDRGEYRVYGLPPGRYVIGANPMDQRSDAFDRREEAEMDALLAALRQRGTAPAPAAAPNAGEPTAAGETATWGFPLTFYPGTPAYGQAERFRVAAGETRAGLDFIVAPVRMAVIAGTVTSGDGRPPGRVQMSMIIDGPTTSVFTGSRPALSRAGDDEGAFRYTNVPPGRYRIVVRESDEAPTTPSMGIGASTGGGILPARQAGDATRYRFAMTDVDVNGQPVTTLALVLQPGATVAGHVEVTSDSGRRPDLSRVLVGFRPEAGGGSSSVNGTMFGGAISVVRPVAVQADGAFAIPDVGPGDYLLSHTIPGDLATEWRLQSAMLDGVDLLDVPLTVRDGGPIAGLVVTITDRHTELAGSLQTPAGEAAPEYVIVVFPRDPALRRAGSRRVATTRPGTDGGFDVRDLPPGDYLLAALTDVTPDDFDDPTFFDQLAAAAIPIAIRDGERTVQDVRIGG